MPALEESQSMDQRSIPKPVISMKRLPVLLVDDDRNGCALCGMAIDKMALNIQLQTVTDGEDAIDYLEGRGDYFDRSLYPLPTLAVLDLDMRLAQGLAFLSWRRASSSFSSLPVVILSAFAYKGAIELALKMGALTLLATPFELEGWKAIVCRLWDLGLEQDEPMIAAFAAGTGRP
jgi:CheY-like chemotaxis protein